MSSFSSLSTTSNISNLFSNVVSSLEQDIKLLKCISNVRSITSSNSNHELIDKILEIESLVGNFEHNLDEFENLIDEDNSTIQKCKLLINAAIEQKENITHINKNIPLYLEEISNSNIKLKQVISNNNKNNNNSNTKPKILKTKKDTNKISSSKHAKTTTKKNIQQVQQQVEEQISIKEVGLIIEASELDKVSATTKGRVTLLQLNDSLCKIKSILASKIKALPSVRKNATEKEKKLYDEDRKKVTVTESELRSSIIFDSGNSTGQSILQTLRSLSRIKLIRVGSESNYTVI